jgi:hypothetical protein
MTNSIPKRGPVVVKLSNGSLDLWYNRDIRFWILQQKDAEGNQITDEASYHHNRDEAVAEMKTLILADLDKVSNKAIDAVLAEVVAEEASENALCAEFVAVYKEYTRVTKALSDHFLGEAMRIIELYKDEPLRDIEPINTLFMRCPDSVTRAFLWDKINKLKLRIKGQPRF